MKEFKYLEIFFLLSIIDKTCHPCHPLKEFKCANGKCLPISWVCDQKIDCSFDGKDRSDESNCKGSSSNNLIFYFMHYIIYHLIINFFEM